MDAKCLSCGASSHGTLVLISQRELPNQDDPTRPLIEYRFKCEKCDRTVTHVSRSSAQSRQ